MNNVNQEQLNLNHKSTNQDQESRDSDKILERPCDIQREH